MKLDYTKLRPFSSEMLLNILNLLELLLNQNPDNISLLKGYQLLDNYFDRFTSFSDYKQIAYKIWNICMTHVSEPGQIVKYTKFLLRRYYILKETIKKCDNITNFKLSLEEIFRINEINCHGKLNPN